jgi:hypothetical protein
MTSILTLLLGCSGEPAELPSPSLPPQVGQQAPPEVHGPGLDQGQQHPPLPPDNPAWDWDAGGFVSDAQWYGEHGWEGVRMRVAGHLAVAGRDRARLAATQGDFAACRLRYLALDADLAAIPLPEDDWSGQILAALRQAAQRDAEVCGALAEGAPVPASEGLAGLRARALSGETGLDEALEAFSSARSDLAIDDFEDFDDRHRLRVRLFEAYLDSVDPLGFSEPWGYWTGEQVVVQAQAIRRTQGQPLQASAVAVQLQGASDFTVEGLGWLPTGDSLIDVGAQPGPKAIGTLMKLGLDDSDHAAWLATVERSLDEAPSAEIPALVAGHVETLEAYGHGSRFYNIKQLRNEAVRQLSIRGDHDQALLVLEANWPLHNQDWACPNREGILLALKGRLQALAGMAEADATLQASQQAARDFLANIDKAEAGEEVGVRPPMPRLPAGQPEGQGPGPGQRGPGQGPGSQGPGKQGPGPQTPPPRGQPPGRQGKQPGQPPPR